MSAAAPQTPFSWWKLARTFVGLLLAPAIGGAIGLLAFMIPDLASGSAPPDELLKLLWFGLAFGFILGAVPALLIGWPLHLFLLSQKWTSIWVYIGLGALLGVSALFITVPIMEFLEP